VKIGSTSTFGKMIQLKETVKFLKKIHSAVMRMPTRLSVYKLHVPGQYIDRLRKINSTMAEWKHKCITLQVYVAGSRCKLAARQMTVLMGDFTANLNKRLRCHRGTARRSTSTIDNDSLEPRNCQSRLQQRCSSVAQLYEKLHTTVGENDPNSQGHSRSSKLVLFDRRS